MLRQPRPLALALGAVVMTSAVVAAGSWLTTPPPVTSAVVAADAVDAPHSPVDGNTASAPAEDRSGATVSRSGPTPTRASATPEVEASFDLSRHSTTEPGSPWVVVNKRHALPPDHSPRLTDVRGHLVARPAAADLTALLEAADDLGLGLRLVSAHRSYARQQAVYSRAVASRGTSAADAVSARPGHSEHQTGLAVDVTTSHVPACDLHPCFADTTAGAWVAKEAWRYGFIIRYTGTNRDVTGFAFEPWHLRHVGRDLAAEMRRTGAGSLEEALGVTGGDYR